jgi:hypothetical protein
MALTVRIEVTRLFIDTDGEAQVSVGAEQIHL